MSERKNMKAGVKRFGIRGGWITILTTMLLVIYSCGCTTDGDDASSPGETGSKSLAEQKELFDRRYAYLIRGDAEFPTLSSRYRVQTKRAEDDISRVELMPDDERPVDGDDSCQVYRITLKKEAVLMVVVADSIGSGMVAFEFGTLPPGEYTLGTGKFPAEMTRWTKECKRLVISVVVGNVIRHRARWHVTKHGRLAHRLDF